MSWLSAIYEFFCEILFGCSHGNLTRPFTIRAHSYKVCLDCGKQFPYSTEKMRLLHAWEISKQPVVVTELTPAAASLSLVPDTYGDSKAVA